MKIATVALACKAMKVTRLNHDTYQTAMEPTPATITFDDGSELLISEVSIPPTLVRRKTEIHWVVDKCVASGSDATGNSFTANLPEEDVVFSLREMSMIAKEMVAPSVLQLDDGPRAEGPVTFPDCKTNIWTGVAEAVTATGELLFQTSDPEQPS